MKYVMKIISNIIKLFTKKKAFIIICTDTSVDKVTKINSIYTYELLSPLVYTNKEIAKIKRYELQHLADLREDDTRFSIKEIKINI